MEKDVFDVAVPYVGREANLLFETVDILGVLPN